MHQGLNSFTSSYSKLTLHKHLLTVLWLNNIGTRICIPASHTTLCPGQTHRQQRCCLSNVIQLHCEDVTSQECFAVHVI